VCRHHHRPRDIMTEVAKGRLPFVAHLSIRRRERRREPI